MARGSDISRLKQHIQEFSAEISELKKMIHPHMSSQEYRDVYSRFLVLSNLKALAKNELEASMHYYKIVLSGKSSAERPVQGDKVMRSRFKSEINCRLNLSRNLDVSIQSHYLMYQYIRENYASFFQEGKFRIKSIIQLR